MHSSCSAGPDEPVPMEVDANDEDNVEEEDADDFDDEEEEVRGVERPPAEAQTPGSSSRSYLRPYLIMFIAARRSTRSTRGVPAARWTPEERQAHSSRPAQQKRAHQGEQAAPLYRLLLS